MINGMEFQVAEQAKLLNVRWSWYVVMGCRHGLPTSIRALSGKTSVMWTAWPAKIHPKSENRGENMGYPLVMSTVCYWTWSFIVDLPTENVDFPSFFVCLPEGNVGMPLKCRWRFYGEIFHVMIKVSMPSPYQQTLVESLEVNYPQTVIVIIFINLLLKWYPNQQPKGEKSWIDILFVASSCCQLC